MEVFRELEVTGGGPAQRLSFIDEVSKDLPAGWKRDQAIETDLNRRLSDGQKQFAFYISAVAAIAPDLPRPAARLFIAVRNNALTVTNIVPDGVAQLSRSQYNSIILEFQRIASPAARQLGLETKTTSDQVEISELVSPETWQALKSFSAAANKGTGSSHPMDRDRWFEFLILIHTTENNLDTHFLERWLTEEAGWPDDVATDLVVQFEFGTDLLNAYDKQRR